MALGRFHARPPSERTPRSNQEQWAQIRSDAVTAGGSFSDFLKKSIVLTPDMLKIGLSHTGVGETSVVEVAPGFDGAPARWLEVFDRFQQVPEKYDIPDGSNLVQVLISPEVHTVLAEIKRMPGRRVAGERAEAFIRNPFSVLGPDAEKVINAEQFEATRAQAGLALKTFWSEVVHDEQGQLQDIGLVVETSLADEVTTTRKVFETPTSLEQFIKRAEERVRREAQCVRWDGDELELLGDTPNHLQTLRAALDQWLAPEKLSAEDVPDLSRYSDRIVGFGAEEKYDSPFIVRKNEDGGWFPENLEVMVTWPAGTGDPGKVEAFREVITPERIAELEAAIENARMNRAPVVKIPGTGTEIPIKEAEAVLSGVLSAVNTIKSGKAPTAERDPAAQNDRMHLLIKSNIDELNYEESTDGRLRVPDDARPVLPSTLLPKVSLRDHQLAGVTWLQHLWAHSPQQCRGALLADDMGLGKTIQILTFIASCLERTPELPPVLIVAPVALLENWREEVEKFFTPGALPVLTLYGSSPVEYKHIRAHHT
jgi:hypothetical protein